MSASRHRPRGRLPRSVAAFARRAAAGLLLAVFALLAASMPAEAQTSVPANWSLKPSGLVTGNQFRLLFVTSTTRDATSSVIGDYDTHVRNAAAAGHADIQSYSSQFTVVGSTSAVDARDNTQTTGTGVPIYWLNGSKVADNYSDFYDGSWDNPDPGNDESGASHDFTSTDEIFTGSQSGGTNAGSASLGGTTHSRVGQPGAGTPINDGSSSAEKTLSRAFYGISPVFEVAASTDATLSALSLSGVTLSPGFAAAVDTYTASVANSVSSTTVSATANDANATVSSITPEDADSSTAGHQVDLDVGDTAVTVTVTAEDGTAKTYTVTVNREALPVITIASDQETYLEGSTLGFTLSRTGTADTQLSVPLQLSQTGHHRVSTRNPMVNFTAGETTARLETLFVEDADPEETGTYTLTIRESTDYERGDPYSVTVTKQDDGDPFVEVFVRSQSQFIAEAPDAEATATVQMATTDASDRAPERIRVALASHGITAEGGHGNDYEQVAETLIFDTSDYNVQTNGRWLAVKSFPVEIYDDDELEADETFLLRLERHPSTPGHIRMCTPSIDPDSAECRAQITTITIVDNEVTITADANEKADLQLVEGGAPLEISFTLIVDQTGLLPKPSSINLELEGVSAIHDDDFSFESDSESQLQLRFDLRDYRTVLIDGIQRYASTKSVMVRASDDEDVEGAETFNINITKGSFGTLRPERLNLLTEILSVTIVDQDVPTVSISDASASEGAPSVDFTVELDQAGPDEVTVDWATSDGAGASGATAPADYVAASGTLTFAPDEVAKTIAVAIASDTLDEGDETFTVTLSSAVNAEISDAGATGTIEDDDAVEVSLSPASPSVDEGVGNLEFEAALNLESTRTVTVDWALADGTAVSGEDYTAASGTLTFAPGDTAKTITVAVRDDALDEDDETFEVVLSGETNAAVSERRALVTIRDNDGMPSLEIADADTDEGENQTFAVTLSPVSGRAVTVEWATADGTAASRADYGTATGTLTFPAGQTSQTITVETEEDALDEDDETFTVTLSSAVNAAIGDAGATGTIRDDDPEPSLSIGDGSASEGAASMTFEVTLSEVSGREVTVDWATEDGTAVSGADYDTATGTLTFPAGQTSQTITVTVRDDTLDEDDETFTVTLSGAVNAAIGDAGATGTIEDDDAVEVSLSPASPSVDEGVGNLEFEAALNLESTRTVTVDWALADGTAVAGEDYTAASGTLTFVPGDTVKTITVAVRDDALDEDDETFEVALSGETNAAVSERRASVTIRDNDGMPSLEIADTETDEGENQTFAVTLSPVSGRAVTVAWATADGTAVSGADYDTATGTLTFPAGQTSRTITVETKEDALDEDDETFTVTLSSAVNAAIGDDDATGTIRDDDPEPSLSIGDGSASEGAASVTFEVTLSEVSGREVTVDWATEDGTAVSGADYDTATGTLTFPAGQTSQTITVTVRDDTLDEDDETFTVTLSGAVNAAIGDAGATGTIEDDDAVEVSLSPASPSVDEGVGNLEFEAALNLESTRTVTVDWALADGTAVAGEDYTAASGTLTFVPGDTVKTITVAVRDDALDEDDETFEVALSGETNAAVSERRASVTIRDNDGMPSLEIADTETDEGENQTFAATLSPVSGRAVTVAWATADGTAVSGADYDTATGTLTFPAGQTSRTITVETKEDALDEDDETFTVTLSSAVNAAIGDAGATGTIRDDDPEPSLSIGDGSASEGAASVNFEVTLSEVSGREVTVDWATSDGAGASGATAPADYVAASGTLTFAPDEVTKTIAVAIESDTLDEADETFTVTLSSAVNAEIDDAGATGTIEDDDEPDWSLTAAPDAIAEAGTESSTVTVSTGGVTFPDDRTITLGLAGTATKVTDYTVGSETLTLTAGQGEVSTTITAVNDTEDDDAETIIVTAMLDGATIGTQPTITITDDDTPANNAPVITTTSPIPVAENTTAVATLTATDADTGDTLTWSKNGGDDAAKFDLTGSGVLTFANAPDFENPADTGADNGYEVTVRVSDGTATADLALIVNVTDAVETATLAITGLANATVAENTAWTSSAPTLTGSPVGAVTWTLEGTDAGDFTIDPGTGEVSMVARDYENPADADTDNAYEVTVKATDADANTATMDITVTVTDAVETATLAITGLANATVAENTAWTSPAPTLTGTPVGAVTWTLEGTDAGDFTIDPGTGEVSMVARDYENPEDADTDNAYEVTVKATDADANTAAVAITVTVTDVVETATLAIGGLANATVAENTAWTSSAPTLTGSPVGAVTWTLEGTDAGDFTIDPGTGEVSMVARDYENPADADTDNAYEVTVKATDADANTATMDITVTVTDAVETATLAITGLANATVAENTAWTSPAPTLTGTPVGAVTWTLEGTDAGDFTIDPGTGEVSMVARDYENSADADTDNAYEVTVKATDADANTAAVAITVTVTDVVETATLAIGGLANATVAENTAWTSSAPTLTGSPVGAVTWTLEGTDAGDFTIDPGTGEVSMVARDYENPADADTDNAYEVTVKATDADANTATMDITVTVTDAVETATLAITGLANATVAENTAWTSPAPTLTGTPVGAVTWTLEGTDAGDFTIDPGTGEVSMVARDYENPEDADTDNAYEVTVKATDADANTAAVAITVTVADVLEPPDAPAAPSVSSVSGSTTSLDVRWSAPGTNGGPPLTGYRLRYREGTTGNWTNWAHSGTGTSATITNLSASISYQVQVRALNGETPGDWSPSGTGSTGIATAAAVTLVLTPPSIAEDARISTVTATVSPASTTAFTVAVSALAVSPALAADFSLSANTTLSFAANAPQSTGLVTITAVDDTVDAPAKTVTVSGTVTGGTNVTAPSDVTLTITDDDAAPVFADGASTVREVAENTAADQAIGTPVTATDADADTMTYALGGTDAASFAIDTASGQLKTGAALDHEVKSSYAVTVTASDGNGNSAGIEVTIEVTDVAEAPGKPVAPTVSAAGASSVTVIWEAPANTGPAITDYDYRYRVNDPPGTWIEETATAITALTATIGTLAADTAYDVQVRAANDEGTGEWSDSGTGSTTTNPLVTLVLTPDTVAEGETGTVTATVSPVSTAAFTVTVSAAGDVTQSGTTLSFAASAGSSTGTVTITATDDTVVGPGKTATVSGTTTAAGVTAPGAVTLTITDDDAPAWDVTVDAETIAEAGGASTVTVSAGSVTFAADQTIVLELGGSATIDDDYEVGSMTLTLTAGESATTTTLTAVDDAVDDDAETIVVTAKYGGAAVGPQPTVTITDDDAAISTPGAPTNIEATADGTDTIDLEWKAPTETGGAAITGYRIEWSADGSTNWADRVADTGSTATMYSDNPLDPGTMRHYRVSAINSEGTGDPSGVADATTDVPVTVTVPATKSVAEDGAVMTVDIRATTGVDAQPPRPFEIQLVTADGTAVSPGDYGAVDATITFDVANFSREDIGGGVQRWVALKTPPISIVDDSATEDDETFTVTLSRPADLSSAITLGSRKETTVTILDDDGAVPGAPTQLSATADGTDTIDLTWMAPGSTGGKPITGYRIEFSDDAGTAWTALVADTGTTGTSHSDTTVARNSTRHYRVSAINRIGTGPASISAHATTADRDPPYPTITYEGPATGGFEVKVTWSEAVTGFEGIDPDACCLGDLHAGYDGGPDVLIRSLTEVTTGLEYTAVVPIAPPSGKPRLTVYILDGAATGVVGGLENVYGYLHFAVDADGYPTEVRAPVAQRVEIVPPGGRSNRNAFSTRNNDVDVVWATGDAVEVRVTFSEPVTVDLTDGTPMLGLVVAGQARSARYSHGSGTEALTFSYRVTPGDGTVTAVSVTANSLALDGATLRNDAGVDADLTHPGASIGGAPAEPALTVADAEAASGELSFRVTLSRAASAPVTVDWATADGTAMAGDDYEASSGTLTFVAGETEKTVAVAVLADGVAEAEEALTLTLSNPTGAALEDAQATGTIADAGEPPNSGPGLTASIAAASQSALASAVHTGAADAPQLVVRFDAAVATLAATTPSLRLEGASVRSVSRLDTAGREWLFLLRPDGDGGILARLEAGRPCDRGGICTASGSVLSEVPSRAHAIPGPDGPVPGVALVGISVASSPADGTAYAAGERIEATASFAAPVEVDTGGGTPRMALVVGGATRMAAWTAGSGTASLVFAYTVTAADTGDGDVPVGGVRVGAGGLDLNGGVIRAAATPPKAEPALTVADAEAASGTLSFRVTLAPAATAPVTVDWATSDETATAGADYTSASGTLAFAPGETGKTVTVAVLADGVAESEETLTLALANPSGAALEDAQATGTIADAGEPAPAAVPLTASFTDPPPAHAGSGTFTFRILFSEPVGIGYKTLRDESFATTGGAVTGARRVDGRSDLWEIEVEPAGDSDVAVTLAGGRACDEGGAVCTRDGRRLSGTVSLTVPGPGSGTPEAPLTASFTDAPREHDGAAAFTFRILFSEPVGIGHKTLRDESLAAVGGTVRRAKRVDGRSDLWEIEVEPDGLAGVVVTLAGGRACATAGAVCTKDGKPLSATVSLTVRGPAALSVADARAKEGTDATIDFAVTLDRAASGTVTVDYATSDGTAVAGADYTRAVGTLTFAAGETEKTVAVAVLDDARDEGEERFTLTLSNASGAYIADGEAAGIIENDDPMPAAWLARFGRTVGTQVVDAVTARLEGGGGSHVTVGGQNLAAGGAAPDDPERREAEARLEAMSDWLRGETAGDGAQRSGSRTMTERELLLGSSFHLASENEDRGLSFAAWGRMATGRFDADVDEVRLDGDVTTAILGADVESGRWLAGAALSHSRGTGGYALGSGVESVFGEGEVESTLTSVTPYARLELSERVSAWGLVGYGTGELTLTEGSGEETNRYTADIALRMGAAGARGTLLAPEEAGGFELAVESDAMWVRMTSETVEGMEGSETDTSRVRLILDGSRSFEMGGGTLTPSLELGLRHDGGDAETGTGVEVGAGIRYAQGGVTVESAVRTLVAHEEAGYEEWGASGSVRIDPGASGRGLAFSVAPTWGNASSGAASLWSAHDASALAPDGEFEAGRRLEVEAGYGLGVPRALGTVTPYAGLSLADGSERSWRAGARWQVAPGFSVSLEGTRREPANDDAPEHGLTLRGALRW